MSPSEQPLERVDATPTGLEAARNLRRAARTIAFVVLADSGLEHYRAGFFNRVMFVAPAVSTLLLVDNAPRAQRSIPFLAIIVGGIGTAFHVWNVVKREGGVSWLNVFYGAPLGAPLGLTYGGIFALAASHAEAGEATRTSARLLAGVTAAGLAGTAAEAALFHFRGAFHNKVMYVPIVIPPAAAMALGAAALRGRSSKTARRLLQLTVGVGVAGMFFHALAIQRQMGGWKNWSQNILDGPPIPAPPSFTAMALAGLAALTLMRPK